MRALLKLALSAAILALGIGSAPAVETGSAAWTDFPLNMFEGPGKQYQWVGEVPGQIPVRVDRCSGFWCLITVGYSRGWVDRYKLSFGRAPYPNLIGPLYLPPLGYKEGGPGLVCLYSGLNFTGKSLCAEAGFNARDLLLLHRDNLYSSVRIEGDVSVTLCRDRDFKSYCDRINYSQPELNGFLAGNVSSVHVH